MPSPQPVLNMPSKTAAAKALLARGMRPAKIARLIGVPTARRVTALLQPKKRRSVRTDRTVSFPRDTLEMLAPDAAKRGMSLSALAIAIVFAAADDGLIDGILDDVGSG